MPLQRALLLFFAVMLVSAAAASLVRTTPPQSPTVSEAAPATTTEEQAKAPEELRTHDAAEARATDADALELKVGDTPGESTFPPDRHLILTVNSEKPGQVEVSGLGLIATVVPRTPAVFDLFTQRTGEFPIEFTAAGDDTAVLVGTLVVEKSG